MAPATLAAPMDATSGQVNASPMNNDGIGQKKKISFSGKGVKGGGVKGGIEKK